MFHVPFNRSALAYPTVQKNVTAASKESGVTRERLVAAFKEANIDARVFCWPLSSLPMFPPHPDNHVAWDIPGRAFNLPSYHDITVADLDRICEVVVASMRVTG
jgi:dTDP-4-amino-4,6-dideoxygalactose transaminase